MSAPADAPAADANGDVARDTAAPPPGALLGLPAPRPGAAAPTHSLDLSSGSASVSLDVMGPVVVNVDGALARIGNWAALTPAEQAVTQRRIAARNNERLAALRAAQATGPPLD